MKKLMRSRSFSGRKDAARQSIESSTRSSTTRSSTSMDDGTGGSAGGVRSSLGRSNSFRSTLARQVSDKSIQQNEFIITPATRDSEGRTRLATQDMTINKLRFQTLPLIGRSDEVSKITESAKRASNTKSRELILISGESGTGKTALAKAIEANHECMFISSKFDALFRDKEPFAGISGACREICRELLLIKEVDEDRFLSISAGIEEVLGPDDQSLLATMISGFDELFSIAPQKQKKRPSMLQDRMNRTVYTFRRLFRKLCEVLPKDLVILLDDCQWADFASLYVTEMLLTDEEIEGLVVIACYRSDEVYDAHIFSQMKRNLQEKADKSQRDFHITKVHVGNFLVNQVQEFVRELVLANSNLEVKSLAELCHKKTLGNVFFLRQFMAHLHELSLIKYNFGLMKWTWDEDEISANSATDNVLDLLKNKLSELDPSVNKLLAILACLGSEFPEMVVDTVWSNFWDTDSDNQTSKDQLSSLLEIAVVEGFLEHHPSTTSYQFVHDKVHESCLDIVDPLRLPHMKTNVGRIVLQELEKESFPGHYLFVAVNLLNEGLPPDNEKDQVALAGLNLKAAASSVDSSSFTNASQYVQYGAKLLPNNKWSDAHYELTRDLFSLGAEVECFLANVELMQRYCDGILEQKERPLCDKFRAYNVLQNSLVNRFKHFEGVELGVEVSKKLGCGFPKTFLSIQFSTVFHLLKALRFMKKLTVERINSLPVPQDPMQHQLMQTLDKTITCCFLAEDDRLVLTILKNFEASAKLGLCEYSAPAFATFGVILATLGDFDGLAKITECCFAIVERIESRNTMARTLNVLNAFVCPWYQPYQDTRKQLLNAYNLGLLSGDVENAMWSIAHYTSQGLFIGKSIQSSEAEVAVYLKQSRELKQEQTNIYLALLEGCIQELSGTADSEISLDPASYAGFNQLFTKLQLRTFDMHRNRHCAIMGYYAEGAELAIKRGNEYAEECKGLWWNMTGPFYAAICLFAAAGKQKKKKFQKLAMRHRAKIKEWTKKGCPNTIHLECLLDAEKEALKRNSQNAEHLFHKGIVMAARTGFVVDAALGSERCADFLLSVRQDHEGASYRMQEAFRYYKEWGAMKKVKMLEEKHADLLQSPPGGIVLVGRNSTNANKGLPAMSLIAES